MKRSSWLSVALLAFRSAAPAVALIDERRGEAGCSNATSTAWSYMRIPKTGSTSFEAAVGRSSCDGRFRRCGHFATVDEVAAARSFGVIREPYGRFVSCFEYLRHRTVRPPGFVWADDALARAHARVRAGNVSGLAAELLASARLRARLRLEPWDRARWGAPPAGARGFHEAAPSLCLWPQSLWVAEATTTFCFPQLQSLARWVQARFECELPPLERRNVGDGRISAEAALSQRERDELRGAVERLYPRDVRLFRARCPAARPTPAATASAAAGRAAGFREGASAVSGAMTPGMLKRAVRKRMRRADGRPRG